MRRPSLKSGKTRLLRQDENDGKMLFEKALSEVFRQVVQITFRHPGLVFHYIGVLYHQWRASLLRKKNLGKGISVPPVMIFSVTKSCNLSCRGCYARLLQDSSAQEHELTQDEFIRVIKQAQQLGISIVFLAGGEPLLRPGLIGTVAVFDKMQFLLFTNGTLLDQDVLSAIKKSRNIFPMLSIEGGQVATDSRRGEGVFGRLEKAMSLLQKAKMPFGLSLTVTIENIDQIVHDDFVGRMVKRGCRVFIFVSYIPVSPETASLVLTPRNHLELSEKLTVFRKKYPALFISFPGDEEQFGGCLSAGRGFIHLSAAGDVEPCPFSPFSDVNIRSATLSQALASGLLKTIRDNRDKIEEHGGACALYEHRDWVRSVAGKLNIHTEGSPASSLDKK